MAHPLRRWWCGCRPPCHGGDTAGSPRCGPMRPGARGTVGPMSMRRVDRAVADYTALRPRLLPATDEFVELVTGTIDDAGINYLSVTGRTKTIGSFAAKAR